MHLLMEIINASSPGFSHQTVILRCANFINMYSVMMCVEMSGTKCRQNQQFTYSITVYKLIEPLFMKMAASWTKYFG